MFSLLDVVETMPRYSHNDMVETMPRYSQITCISITRSSVIMANYCLITFLLNLLYISVFTLLIQNQILLFCHSN